MNPNTNSAYRLLHNGILAFARTERAGIRVNVDYLRQKKEDLTNEIDKLEEKFKTSQFYKDWKDTSKTGAVNINSSRQLSNFLYNIKGIEPPKLTMSGYGSTDEETLQRLKLPQLKSLIEIRKLKKLRDTYLDAFLREQVDGYIHPFFNLHLVKTFRSSSSNLNFQNIPKRDKRAMETVRKAIYPRPGHQLLEVDFSGLEVRISACVIGNTKIQTIDGPESIRKVIDRVENKEDIYVYGYSNKENRVKISKVQSGGITKIKAKVLKITLDNGKHIIITPDHKFILRSGEFVEATNLKTGDSLMPFYKKKVKSRWKTVYEDIYLNNGKHIRAHNLIALDIYGTNISKGKKVIHHKDHNGCNNSLDNLELMSRSDHMHIHSIEGWKNNRKSRTTDSWMKTRAGKEHTKKLAERMKNLSPEERKKFGQKISDSIKHRGGYFGKNNPMYGRKQNEETKQKISQSKKGKKIGISWNKGLTKENDSRVAKISESKKGKPSWSKGKKLGPLSEETKRKISIALKGRDFSADIRKKLSINKKKYWKSKPNEICKICGKELRILNNYHLVCKHNLTLKEYRETYNHTVISVEYYGRADVYNINVEDIHSYALEAGVIVKNCYHKDKRMLEYINDPKSDMHKDLCEQIFRLKYDGSSEHQYLRDATKNGFVFPQFYGDYYKNCAEYLACKWGELPTGQWREGRGVFVHEGVHLSDHLREAGMKSLDKFTEHIRDIEEDFWENRFYQYDRWKNKWWAQYKENGYVDMYTGFRCSGVMGFNDAINYPIQGSAFHCLLWSFIQLDAIMQKQNWDTRLIGQIHDSIILDVNPNELNMVAETIKRVTCTELPNTWDWIIVPLTVDAEICPVDGSWAEKEKYKL